MEINALTIPAPWGHISAKVWGNVDSPPIICFHGIMTNFNRLIPLLPPNYRYVCVDLLGIGKFAPVPLGLLIDSIDSVWGIWIYFLTMNYLGREKYTIIGHSYEGIFGLIYSKLYPERVEKLIMLDPLHLFPTPAKIVGNYLLQKFDQQREPPIYTYAMGLSEKINVRPYGKLFKDSVAHLLERKFVPLGVDKIRFFRDQILKNFINSLPDFQYILESFDWVSCPVMIIVGQQSPDQQILKYFGSNNFIVKSVEGDHDVHLTRPELVAPHIIKFLQKNKL